jgi:hypothetical protein
MRSEQVTQDWHEARARGGLHGSIGLAAVLGVGVLLRIVQYLSATSLWYDELALARNIRDHSLVELLFRPLEHLQVAPAGFLAAAKISVHALGMNELGLRAVPWACSILALLLFWRVTSRIVRGPALVASLALFSFSPAMTWYSGILKQYSSDVAMTLLVVFLALGMGRGWAHRRPVHAGLLGAIAILFSHAALLTAGVLGAGLVTARLFRKKGWPERTAAITLSIWGVSGGMATLAALRITAPETLGYMRAFWVHGFLPRPWDPAFLMEAPRRLFQVFSHALIYVDAAYLPLVILVAVPALLAVVGGVWLARSNARVAAMILSPLVGGVAAASFQVLPLHGRVALYVGWPVLVLAGCGIEACRRWKAGWGLALATGAMVSLALLVALGVRPPFRMQESRPILEEVARRWQPGDVFYAYYGARHAIAFYGPRSGLSSWIQGECHRGDPRAYFRELDRLRGESRAWVFFTHALPGYREPETMLSYLDAIGVRLDVVPDPYGLPGQGASGAYLFDLSDAVRLAASDWRSFPVEFEAPPGLRGCDRDLMESGSTTLDLPDGEHRLMVHSEALQDSRRAQEARVPEREKGHVRVQVVGHPLL